MHSSIQRQEQVLRLQLLFSRVLFWIAVGLAVNSSLAHDKTGTALAIGVCITCALARMLIRAEQRGVERPYLRVATRPH